MAALDSSDARPRPKPLRIPDARDEAMTATFAQLRVDACDCEAEPRVVVLVPTVYCLACDVHLFYDLSADRQYTRCACLNTFIMNHHGTRQFGARDAAAAQMGYLQEEVSERTARASKLRRRPREEQAAES